MRLLCCKRISVPELIGCIIAVIAGGLLAQEHGGSAEHGSGPSLEGNVIALVGSLGAAAFLEYSGGATARLGLIGYFACMQTCTAVCLMTAALAVGPAAHMVLHPFDEAHGVLGFLLPHTRRLGVVSNSWLLLCCDHQYPNPNLTNCVCVL